MNAHDTAPQAEPNWQAIFDRGDNKAYRALVEPEMPELLKAAKRRIQYYIQQGLLQANDLTPEEVVGETLITAWDERSSRPANVSLRGWLLGVMYRAIQKVVENDREYRDRKVLSIEEEFNTPGDTGAVQEQTSEFVYADDAPRWEEMIPGRQPVDYELPLTGDTREALKGNQEAEHVLMLHDEFDMPLDEVAFVLNQNLQATERMLQEARASIGEAFRPPFPDEKDAETP